MIVRVLYATQLRSWLILSRLSSPEAPEEAPSVTEENVSKVECNISGNTNFMLSGIMEVCSYRLSM
jgi:ubiquitin carboxyl-terminal hydrolase 14